MLSASTAAGLAPTAAINAGAYAATAAGAGGIATLAPVVATGVAGGAAAGGAGAAAAGAAAGAGVSAASKLSNQSQSDSSSKSNEKPAEQKGMLAKTTDFMKSAGGSALISGGLNAMSSYMQAKAQEDDEAINALYGVSPREGDTNLTPEQVRFTEPMEDRNSWRPRLMYDA